VVSLWDGSWLNPDRAGVLRRGAVALVVAAVITACVCTPVAIRAAEPDDDSVGTAELVNVPPNLLIGKADEEPG
jgi:hypothetical protein